MLDHVSKIIHKTTLGQFLIMFYENRKFLHESYKKRKLSVIYYGKVEKNMKGKLTLYVHKISSFGVFLIVNEATL